jgi:hypothetical protein
MNPDEIIEQLRQQGIELQIEGVNIRVRSGAGGLNEFQKALVVDHKAKLIEHLSSQAESPKKPGAAPAAHIRCERADGSVVYLTQEEYDEVVDLFRMLLRQDAKLRREKRIA